MSFMESLGSGGKEKEEGGKGEGDSSWTRRRVSCARSCHFPILLARLQPVASWSLVAAPEEPGVEVYQIGRRLVGT